MTQSAPSRTALATSEASALVGLGLLTIDSSIWVAQITPFAALLHFAMIWKEIEEMAIVLNTNAWLIFCPETNI
jgi:hypothetical protein